MIKAPIIALNEKYPKNKDIEAIQIDQRDADDDFYRKALVKALPPRYLRKVVEELNK